MGYREEVLADSPSAYFRLGETVGTSAVDEIGGAAGTYTGGFTLNSASLLNSDRNPAVALNGTTGYVAAADRAAFDLGDVFTLEAWVRLNSVTFHGFVDKGTNAYVFRTDATNHILLRRNNVADVVTSTTTLSTGQTYHVVATKNGAATKLYVNGVDVTGTVTNQTMTDTAIALSIGAADAGTTNFLNGLIDEVAVYPAALSQARVQVHYAAGIGSGVLIPRRADRGLIMR